MSNNAISARLGTDVVIRIVGPGDANTLAKLRYEFRSSFGANCGDETSFVERSAKWMQDRLYQAEVWRCWIAECDGVAAGNIWTHLIEKIPNPMIEPERLGCITDSYVHENYCDRGVGTQLFSAAIEWIKESDVDAVILWPTERSRTFYRRKGFSETVRVMEMTLDPQHT